ncbi:Hypothetical predicted protein [Paramuricea clavata]|uniref:Uncharacterized protein n=1 Tax=Paramuricea clavata TaxID=317549 RepID=A0A6S7FVY2_PARCT|nr:Hypothetical predicted protein [Paramuricea clavata]
MEIRVFNGVYLICALVLLASPVRIDAQRKACRVQNLERTVKRNDGCQMKFIVQACRGTCNSEEVHLERSPFVLRQCNCCKSAGNITTQDITFTCSSGNVNLTVPSVTKCACLSCK